MKKCSVLRFIHAQLLFLVQEEGLEPTLSLENWILSPARLPIPPLLPDGLDGGLPWNRTKNPQIKSLLLYQIELTGHKKAFLSLVKSGIVVNSNNARHLFFTP